MPINQNINGMFPRLLEPGGMIGLYNNLHNSREQICDCEIVGLAL
jgi:hypothetical protein